MGRLFHAPKRGSRQFLKPNKKANSMGQLKIIGNTEQLTPRRVFFTLYGHGGVYKTTLSFSAKQKVLLFDFDRGIARADQTFRSDYAPMDNFDDFYSYVMDGYLETDVKEKGYQTVVLDTIGTMLDDHAAPWLISQDASNGNGQGGLSLRGWGNLKTLFGMIRNKFVSLNLGIVAICHAKEDGEGNNRSIDIAVSGGTSDIINRACDMMGYMYPRGDKMYIDFRRTQEHAGKTIIDWAPEVLPAKGSPEIKTYLSDIEDRCMAKMMQQSAAAVSAMQLVGDLKGRIEACTTKEDLDLLNDEIGAVKSKTIKTQISAAYRDKLKELGYEYNKETKEWELKPDPSPLDGMKEKETLFAESK